MPMYEFECERCGAQYEEFHTVKYCPERIMCECGMPAVKILPTSYAVHGDRPLWMEKHLGHIRNSLQDESEKPIESRTELKRHLKEKGIVETPAKRP